MVVSELYQATNRFSTDFTWLSVAKYFDRVDSTQKRVLQFLTKDALGPLLIMAESQTKGVGRQGRSWISPPGGVWFTLALPLSSTAELSKVSSFSLVAALVVAQSLKEVNNLECKVKWPNDIKFKDKKLGGILINTTKKYKKDWLLVGIGINVNNEITGDLAKEATSIAQIRGQKQGRSRLIESIINALWTAWQDFPKTGFGPYQKQMEEILFGVSKPAKVMMGTKSVEGVVTGVDPDGGLLLKSGSDVKTVRAGEIVGLSA